MRSNYIALIGFVMGIVGTVIMYETRPAPGSSHTSADAQLVSAARDASTAKVCDPS
jgi:hypothetical protein